MSDEDEKLVIHPDEPLAHTKHFYKHFFREPGVWNGRIVCYEDDVAADYSKYEDCRKCEVVHLKGQHLTLQDVAPEHRWNCEECGTWTMPGILVCKECRNARTD